VDEKEDGRKPVSTSTILKGERKWI